MTVSIILIVLLTLNLVAWTLDRVIYRKLNRKNTAANQKHMDDVQMWRSEVHKKLDQILKHHFVDWSQEPGTVLLVNALRNLDNHQLRKLADEIYARIPKDTETDNPNEPDYTG